MYTKEKNDAIIEKWSQRAASRGDGDVSPDGVYFKGDYKQDADSDYIYRESGDEDKQWNEAETRILFVSKDPNEEDNAYDFRSYNLMRNPDGSLSFGCRFNKNLLRITAGLASLTKDGYPSFAEVQDEEFVNRKWDETAVARINVKKHSGGSSVSDGELKESIANYGDLILEQLSLHNPNFIVCCGASNVLRDVVVKDYLGEDPEEIKSESDNWIYYSPSKKVWVIHSYHLNPRSVITDAELYETIMSNLQKSLQKHA